MNTKSLIVCAVLTLGTVAWWRNPQRHPTPSAAPLPEHSQAEVTASSTPPPIADSVRVRELEGRIHDESRARQQAEAEAVELLQRVAPLADKVVVSLGTIDDIGQRTGAILPALHDLQTLSARDRTTLTPEEKRRLLDLQRKHADVLGMLPEIAGFQDNPAEYGRFFRTMLQQSAALNDAQATQVETFMRQRGESLVQLGLNTAREPTDPQLEEKWEDQRDAFNAQTANGLQRLLPPGAADKAGLTAELMEFLEMDFDKLQPDSPAKP